MSRCVYVCTPHTPAPIHPNTHAPTHSFMHILTYQYTQTLTHSHPLTLSHSQIYTFPQSHTHTPTQSYSLDVTHSHTHTFSHSHTHILAYSHTRTRILFRCINICCNVNCGESQNPAILPCAKNGWRASACAVLCLVRTFSIEPIVRLKKGPTLQPQTNSHSIRKPLLSIQKNVYYLIRTHIPSKEV